MAAEVNVSTTRASDADATTAIGVVLVTHNSADLVEPCLDALARSATAPLDVVVVDNASDDDTVGRAGAHPISPRVIATGVNGGYAAGINRGIRELAPTQAVLVLNPDCRLDPGALDTMADALASSNAGVIAPLIRERDGTVSWSLYRRPTLLRALGDALLGTERAGRHPRVGEQETREAEYGHAHDVDWASGAVLLISPECRAATGRWDEGYFLYSEESDFQLRAGDAGYRVRFDPAATTTHDGGDAPVSGRLWALLAVNRVRLYGTRHRLPATATYHLVVVLTELIRALRGRRPSRAALAAWSGRPADGPSTPRTEPDMCGIVGIRNLDGRPVDEQLLRDMAGTLVHRGPDGDGFFIDGPTGFGHTRLSIIDIAGSPQPMSIDEGVATITFNGEILNYQELRRRSTRSFRTAGDTETILARYLDRGEDMLDELRGQFAFAIHDRRDGSLLLARDRLGIIPLYYAVDGTRVVFASGVKALLPALRSPRSRWSRSMRTSPIGPSPRRPRSFAASASSSRGRCCGSEATGRSRPAVGGDSNNARDATT
ncbi:MAG: glycosyltransferase [Acidimicrobiales bacterium]